MDFFLIWLFPALILGGIGCFFLFSTLKHIKRCQAIVNWSTAQASVESSQVEQFRSRHYNSLTRTAYRTKHYTPKIEYSYNVLGKPFRSSEYSNFTGTYPTHSEAEAAMIVQAYPVGKSVPIRYDPNNPSDALLVPETSTQKLDKSRKGLLVLVAVALVWFLIGAVLNLSSWLGQKHSEAQIEKSTGLLPLSTEAITENLTTLADQYKLDCHEEGAAGYTLAYEDHVCWSAAGDPITSIEVYSRKDAPEKVDCVSAVFTPSNQEEASAFFKQIATLAFSVEDLAEMESWIDASLPGILAGESTTLNTTFAGIEVTFDDLGETVRLNIGDLQ